MAMVLTTVLALAVGVYAASRHNRAGRLGVMAWHQLGIAIPNFWFAILLILLFSVQAAVVSAGGFPGWTEDSGGGPLGGAEGAAAAGDGAGRGAGGHPGAHHALGRAGGAARRLVRTARAKGLSRRATLWGHVLRNAMIPVVTVMGLQFANLLAGTIVVENVFYLPGLGRLIFQSIANRDLIVVRNCVMLLAAMVVIVNFVVDCCTR
jgi:peptide/nickel transport system permease protein